MLDKLSSMTHKRFLSSSSPQCSLCRGDAGLGPCRLQRVLDRHQAFNKLISNWWSNPRNRAPGWFGTHMGSFLEEDAHGEAFQTQRFQRLPAGLFFRWCRSFSIEEDEHKNDDCSVWIAPSAYCVLRSYERDGGKE